MSGWLCQYIFAMATNQDSEELLTFGKVYRQLKAVSAFPIQAQWFAWEPGWSLKAPRKDPHIL